MLQIFKDKNIQETKKIDKNIHLLILKNETMLVIIENDNNVFSLNRNIFKKIEDELLDYDFYLYSNLKKQGYYIKIKEPNNIIRKAFDLTKKDNIFFGKEVLQNKVNQDDIKNLIEKIGK